MELGCGCFSEVGGDWLVGAGMCEGCLFVF